MDNYNESTLIKRERKIDIFPILYLVGFYFLESIAATVAIPLFKTNEMMYAFVWIISKLVPLILVIVLFKKKFAEAAKKTSKSFGKFIGFTAISFLIFYFFEIGTNYYQMVMDKIFHIGESSNQNGIYEYFLASSKSLNYILLFITVVILAPILEEFEFRVLVFDAFKGCHFLVAATVSALGFGLLHMDFTKLFSSEGLMELSYLPIYSLPGFCLALIYHYNDHNFFSNMLVHMIVNGISFVQIMNLIQSGQLTI